MVTASQDYNPGGMIEFGFQLILSRVSLRGKLNHLEKNQSTNWKSLIITVNLPYNKSQIYCSRTTNSNDLRGR